MPIPPLYGHEGTRNRLVGAIASGRLPQALLFEGPRGVGKQRLALWLAQALVCERAGGEAREGCGECQQCKLVLNLSHPDVHWFVPLELTKKSGDADKQVEVVEEALAAEMAARREQPLYEAPSGLASHGIAAVRLLLRRLALKPAMGSRKGFVIGGAERLAAAVKAGPARRYAFALTQQPFQARGGFTGMLDGLLERLREQARSGEDTGSVVRAIAQVLEARTLAQGNVNPQLVAAVLGGPWEGEGAAG